MVTGSHQQATADMVSASRAVLADLKLSDSKLFLGGWSQGGFVTLAMLERLEADGVPVKAAATASAPSDAFVGFNGFLNFPRKIDAAWIPTIFILSAFSFEEYYGVPGLARALLTEESYDVSRKAYLREPFDPAAVPTDLKQADQTGVFRHAVLRQFRLWPHRGEDAGLSLGGEDAGADLLWRDRRGDQHRARAVADDLSKGDRQRQGRGGLDRADQPSRHLRHRRAAMEELVRRAMIGAARAANEMDR